MFEINYRIVVEDTKELLSITSEIFDKDFEEFEGLIELNFDGSKIGYIFEGEISEDMLKVGCFQDEWLLSWFTRLIKSAKLLQKNDYLILSEIECDDWIEFTKIDNIIRVKELRKIPSNISNYKIKGTPIMSVSPLVEEIVLNTGERYSKEVEFKPTKFADSFITCLEFEQEVKRKSKMLLNEIRETFPNLINSKAIKEFEEILNSIDD